MPNIIDPADFQSLQSLLENARIHFKFAFGITATHPPIQYLSAFAFGSHVADRAELALSSSEEEQAFATLEHCATFLAVVQIHTVMERLHAPHHFSITEREIADAFQISRLLRNAFAHNPFDPVWEIRTTWQNRCFVVPDVISLNTTGLDGSRVRREHYGGPISVLRFLDYAERIVTLRRSELT